MLVETHLVCKLRACGTRIAQAAVRGGSDLTNDTHILNMCKYVGHVPAIEKSAFRPGFEP